MQLWTADSSFKQPAPKSRPSAFKKQEPEYSRHHLNICLKSFKLFSWGSEAQQCLIPLLLAKKILGLNAYFRAVIAEFRHWWNRNYGQALGSDFFCLQRLQPRVFGHMKGKESTSRSQIYAAVYVQLSLLRMDFSLSAHLDGKGQVLSMEGKSETLPVTVKTSQVSTWLIMCVILLFFVSKYSQMRGRWPNQLAGLL